jgi:hypothetical protein
MKVNIFEISTAARYIADNNPCATSSYEDIELGIFEAIGKFTKDKTLGFTSKDGWSITKRSGDILEVTVAPYFGSSYYVDAANLVGGF